MWTIIGEILCSLIVVIVVPILWASIIEQEGQDSRPKKRGKRGTMYLPN